MSTKELHIIGFFSIFTVLAISLFAFAACTNTNTANNNSSNSSEKILVVYFSATGNTKTVAESTANILGADTFEIVPKIAYTSEDLNYNDSSTRATREQKDANAFPEIANKIDNIAQYGTIIIAHPIWWGIEPKIIDTFMKSYDFSNKKLTSLCTSGMSEIDESANNLKQLAPNATWLDSKRFEETTNNQTIKNWLKEIGLAN